MRRLRSTIKFLGLWLMEVLNLLTTNQFLQNSSNFSKNLQKSSRMSPKILKNQILHFPSMSAAGLLCPNLVFFDFPFLSVMAYSNVYTFSMRCKNILYRGFSYLWLLWHLVCPIFTCGEADRSSRGELVLLSPVKVQKTQLFVGRFGWYFGGWSR